MRLRNRVSRSCAQPCRRPFAAAPRRSPANRRRSRPSTRNRWFRVRDRALGSQSGRGSAGDPVRDRNGKAADVGVFARIILRIVGRVPCGKCRVACRPRVRTGVRDSPARRSRVPVPAFAPGARPARADRLPRQAPPPGLTRVPGAPAPASPFSSPRWRCCSALSACSPLSPAQAQVTVWSATLTTHDLGSGWSGCLKYGPSRF